MRHLSLPASLLILCAVMTAAANSTRAAAENAQDGAQMLRQAAGISRQSATKNAKPAGATKAQPRAGQASAPALTSQNGAQAKTTDVKDFGNWRIFCLPDQKRAPCGMFQQYSVKETGQRASNVLLAYQPASRKYLLEITLPFGVLLPKGVVLATQSFATPPLSYHHCAPDACYVEANITAEAVGELAKSKGDGKLIAYDASGKRLELPLSMKGFVEAWEAMTELGKARTRMD